MNPLRRALRPFGRIAPRMAVIAALAILAFNALNPQLTRLIRNTISADIWPEPVDEARIMGRIHLALQRGGPHGLAIDPELAGLLLELREESRMLFIIDGDGRYLLRPPELDHSEPTLLMSSTRFRIATGEEEAASATLRYIPIPPAPSGTGLLAGLVTVYAAEIWNEETPNVRTLEFGGERDLLDRAARLETRTSAYFNRLDRIRTTAEVLTASVLALALGILTSLLVTRRLRTLAGEVSAPPANPDGLPGPFHARGSDEVAVLARALEAMRIRIGGLVDDLRAQDADRRQWIAQVSHDLRTPLTSLTISLRRAREQADGAVAAELRRAEHDALRLQSLTHDLLELSRLALPDALKLEPVLPVEIVDAALRSVEAMACDKSAVLSRVARHGDGEVLADGPKLLRALENLLANAVRHARGKVRVLVTADAERIEFAVEDDGEGFEGGVGPVDIAGLAERRGGRAGFGLGLLVALRVAQAHGGSLTASNEADGLTVVRLAVPRLAEAGAVDSEFD